MAAARAAADLDPGPDPDQHCGDGNLAAGVGPIARRRRSIRRAFVVLNALHPSAGTSGIE